MRLRLPEDTPRRALGAGRKALPWILLIVQIALCFQFLRHAGRLELHMTGDTSSYRATGRRTNLTAALSTHRTLVYPALLRYYDRSGRTWKEIPVIQAAVYFAAVVVFFAGLKLYAGSAWLALAAAIPLIYAKSHEFMPYAQTDSFSVALTLVVFGLLFVLAARPRSRLAWIGVALAVLLNYHTRPATQFLILLVPLVAVVLRHCRDRSPVRRLAGWAAGLTAATVVPFLLFALLRLALVGHFGLIAFSGANLIGVTANFLDPWVVKAMPPGEEKVLARRMLDRRLGKGWNRLEFDIPAEFYFDQYNTNVWRFAVPVTRRRFRERTIPEVADKAEAETGFRPPPLLEPRGQWIEQDQMMLDLSREIIRLRPWRYVHWVQQAWRYGLGKIFEDAWILWLLVLLGVSLPLAWLLAPGSGPPPAVSGSAGPAPDQGSILLALTIAAASYFLVHMTLVCLLSYPLSRYVVAACVLWPPSLAALLFAVWRRIVGAIDLG